MKTYEFTTANGHAVTIKTETNEDYYFGMYITCEHVKVSNQWFSITQIKDNTLKFPSPELAKTCAVVIPADIISEIQHDYDAACNNTGKIIVAKIAKASGEVVRELYGKAAAHPVFKSMVYYRMPDEMVTRICTYSSDNKIYCYAGVEDGRREADLLCDENKSTHLWFNHFTPKDPFEVNPLELLSAESCEGDNETYELTLTVVDPIGNN